MKARWFEEGKEGMLVLEPENEDEEHLLKALYEVANEERTENII